METAATCTHHAQSTSPWGSRNTCKMAEDSQWMDGNFPSVSDSSRLQRTRVHLLPPPAHKVLLCLGHADSLEGKIGITFQRHSHTATTTSTSPTSQPTHGAARVSKQVRIFRQWLCFIFLLLHPLHSRKMKNPQNEIEDQIFGLVSEQSREMAPLTLLARSHCLPNPGPWWSVFSCLFGKLAFFS